MKYINKDQVLKKLTLTLLLFVSVSNASADGFFEYLFKMFTPNDYFHGENKNKGGPLIGPDKDNNGIRDDVEIEINKKFKIINKRRYYLQWARQYENVLKLDFSKMNSQKWWRNDEKIHDCGVGLITYAYATPLMEHFKVTDWIKGLVYNGPNRWRKYSHWMDQTYRDNIMYAKLEQVETVIRMDEVCDFKIVKKDLLIKEALDRYYTDFDQISIFYDLESFEKKNGIKYRNRYEDKFHK